MVVTGDGESGSDSGEGAWEMATTSTAAGAQKSIIRLSNLRI